MHDRYRSFAELLRAETEDAFSVLTETRSRECAVAAPHGGGIEPGTSEIARAIAGTDLSLYLFEGAKRSGNSTLHITSSRFDEPRGLKLMRSVDRVLTIHGERGEAEVAYLGGLDEKLKATLQEALQLSGFEARTHESQFLQGLDKTNVCNIGRLGAGLQLELSAGLRRSFFESLSRDGRGRPTKRLFEFSETVRRAVLAATRLQ